MSLETIRCLTLKQPYADLVFFGDKWAENRSWKTNFTGELWIASAATLDTDECKKEEIGPENSPSGMMLGHIMGCVNLVACLESYDVISAASPESLQIMERRNPGRKNDDVEFCKKLLSGLTPESWRHIGSSEYIWIFAEPEMLDKPIPVKGKLGLWRHQADSNNLLLASKRKKKWKA